MSYSHKCDCCGGLADRGLYFESFDVIGMSASWSEISVCRACLAKPMREVMAAACDELDAALDGSKPEAEGDDLHAGCSFCGCDRSTTVLIVATKRVGICAECTDISAQLVAERRQRMGAQATNAEGQGDG